MNKRYLLYFLLAALPALIQGEHAPATGWDWIRTLGMSVYQGLLAIKAYQSPAPNPPPS